MSKMIVGKIDCTKIDKTKLFEGKGGAKYLDVILIPTPDSRYGDDYMIAQSASKEERAKGKRGVILGNAKFLIPQGERTPYKVAAQDSQKEDDGDSVPF